MSAGTYAITSAACHAGSVLIRWAGMAWFVANQRKKPLPGNEHAANATAAISSISRPRSAHPAPSRPSSGLMSSAQSTTGATTPTGRKCPISGDWWRTESLK